MNRYFPVKPIQSCKLRFTFQGVCTFEIHKGAIHQPSRPRSPRITDEFTAAIGERFAVWRPAASYINEKVPFFGTCQCCAAGSRCTAKRIIQNPQPGRALDANYNANCICWYSVGLFEFCQMLSHYQHVFDAIDLRQQNDLECMRPIGGVTTAQQLCQGRCQQLLGYMYPNQVDSGAIAELQSMGIPCVNFFCDNVREFHSIPDQYRPFDLHWVPEFEALPMYKDAKLEYLHAPMPCWVPHELRNISHSEAEPPTFIGSADILRSNLLGHAIKIGADLVIRGAGWEPANTASSLKRPENGPRKMLMNQVAMVRAHGAASLFRKLENFIFPLDQYPLNRDNVKTFTSRDEYVRITREAMVTIGVNRVPTARRSYRNPLAYSRLRDIEAPMLGACYLTEWTSGLAQLYDLGVEIESYKTAEELCFKISELKKDAPRRRSMRERAQRRALADHSIARSIERIRDRLGIPRQS